jgi:low affinity Fe/Cu permease
MFSKFAKCMSKKLGDSRTFTFAIFLIIIWFITGPLFSFSNAWQLVINTGTTIVTFLMVFLLQNTQNRDTIAIHLKLDEIIRAMKDSHNELLKVEELSDEELQDLLKRYQHLSSNIRERVAKGKSDKGIPEIPQND